MRTFNVKPKTVTASTKLDTNKLESQIWSVLERYMKKEGVDVDDLKAYTVLEIGPSSDQESIKVEVRSEYLTSFRAQIEVSQKLDKVVEKYDKDAYFDCEDSGILVAFIEV